MLASAGKRSCSKLKAILANNYASGAAANYNNCSGSNATRPFPSKVGFTNREDEIARLTDILRPVGYGEPGRMVRILGPRDSGKTAMIRELRRRQEEGLLPGLSAYIDMRVSSNRDPIEFARTLWRTLGISLAEKAKVGVKLPGFGDCSAVEHDDKGSFAIQTPSGSLSLKDYVDPLSMVSEALERFTLAASKLCWNGYANAFPTIFIDEANVLQTWDERLLGDLLRMLVRISKQESAANFVLLSSENRFQEWLDTSSPIAGHEMVTMTVGTFPKEEAKEFVRLHLHPERMEEVGHIWDDVFDLVGGGPRDLWKFIRMAKRQKSGLLEQAWEAWKKDRLAAALSKLNAHAFHSLPRKWTDQEFGEVVKKLAEQPDGAVPLACFSALETAVDSMIEQNLLQYRTFGWDRDLVEKAQRGYPLVMPANRLQFAAMKQMLQGNAYFSIGNTY